MCGSWELTNGIATWTPVTSFSVKCVGNAFEIAKKCWKRSKGQEKIDKTLQENPVVKLLHTLSSWLGDVSKTLGLVLCAAAEILSSCCSLRCQTLITLALAHEIFKYHEKTSATALPLLNVQLPESVCGGSFTQKFDIPEPWLTDFFAWGWGETREKL